MLIRSYKYELKYGLIKNPVIPLSICVITVLFAISFVSTCTSYNELTGCQLIPNFGDCILWILKGMKSAEGTTTFYIPDSMWIAFYGVLFYVIGCNSIKDSNFEYQVLVRAGSKRNWWLAKCMWCTTIIIMSQVIVYAVSFVAGLIYKNINMIPQSTVMQPLAGIIIGENINISKIIIMMFSVFVNIIGLMLFQLLMAIVINQVVAFIIIMGILIFSVYVESPLLVGNYLMLMRYEDFVGMRGFDAYWGIVTGSLIAVVCVIIGIFVIRRKDYVTERKELG